MLFIIAKRLLFLAEQGLPRHSFSDGGSLGQNVCEWPAAAKLLAKTGLRLIKNMKSSLPRLSNISAILLTLFAVILAASPYVFATAAKADNDISQVATLSSADVANGQVTVLEINLRKLSPTAAHPKARFRQNAIALFQHPLKPSGIYCGLIGIPLSTTPEKAVIKLEWTDSRGDQAASIPLRILDGKYKKENLKVDSRHVTPSKKNLERIKREKEEVRRIYSSSGDTRRWFGSFKRPLASATTSPYGTQRLFNGQHGSYHRGTDFRASAGTPIYASNSGIVRLAKNLFYSGNIVIVDHGVNIFTLYAHLSEIQVKNGQQIARGQQVGLSGASGRVSGPHLHWAVKVNGVYVDPLQFLTVITSLLER
jgi:murein DD-endopeptidase MepM/ murein hydrolase activator NlpD